MILELFGYPFKMPQSINDLSRKELLFLVQQINSDVDPDDLKLRLFRKALDGSASFKLRRKIEFELRFKPWFAKSKFGMQLYRILDIRLFQIFTYENVHLIERTMDFLFSKDDNLVKQKIPFFYKGSTRYEAPGDYGIGLTFAQFYNTEVAFLNYHQKPSRQLLDTFIDCLYVPKKGKIGFGFGLSNDEKEACLWYWQGVRAMLFAEFGEVFRAKSGSNFQELDIEEYEQQWQDTLGKIAGHPTNYDQTGGTDVRYVLHHMNITLSEQRKDDE